MIQGRARPRNRRMVDALKDASGRVGALNAGGAIAAPFFSNIGQAFRRGEFFAGLFILGFSNGIFERIISAIAQGTIESAILDTFGISVLVWVACFIAVTLLLRQPPEPVTRNDLILGLAVIAAALVPSAKVSWIALTGLGLYGLRCFEAGAPARRAAFVILAVTVPMFWSRLVFAMLSDLILQADAILVSLIVGTERVGNTIGFADNSGYLYILPPCSSLANVSLAVLGWALFTQALRAPAVLEGCLVVSRGMLRRHRDQRHAHRAHGSSPRALRTLSRRRRSKCRELSRPRGDCRDQLDQGSR